MNNPRSSIRVTFDINIQINDFRFIAFIKIFIIIKKQFIELKIYIIFFLKKRKCDTESTLDEIQLYPIG